MLFVFFIDGNSLVYGVLIKVGWFLRAGNLLPEYEIPKNHHLRPLRLRRSMASRNVLSSGEHSLPGVDLAGAIYLSMTNSLTGAGSFLL